MWWTSQRRLGKFQVFDFRLGRAADFFTRTYSFWAGVIGGCFLTTASHGTEQLMVQRLLAARNERRAGIALFASWVVIVFQFTLFLVIGVCLFVMYSDSHWKPPASLDKIYPLFIWEHLPVGVAGLVIAAILAAAMSNLERRSEFAGVHHGDGFLEDRSAGTGRSDGLALVLTGALCDRRVGRGAVRGRRCWRATGAASSRRDFPSPRSCTARSWACSCSAC